MLHENRDRNTSVLGALSLDVLITSMTVIDSTNKKQLKYILNKF